MSRVGICLTTKDRVELTKRAIVPLLGKPFDLFVCDGSSTPEGVEYAAKLDDFPSLIGRRYTGVRGGADAAIVYALSTLLDHPNNYDYVGIVENDVLLDDDWFEPTMELFEKGKADGLEVGAVSPRCYADRILLQRPGYAVMHNLGAGVVIFTRIAAELVLAHYRTGHTLANRACFSYCSGIDIGRYWAFKGGEHWITADWHFDTTLAHHGYASLALTPAKCFMLGQDPPLADQGLELVTEEIKEFRNEPAFLRFRQSQAEIRGGLRMPDITCHREGSGEIIFPHQLKIDNQTSTWALQWSQGFGPFSWKATDQDKLTFNLFGTAHVVLNGGENGAQFRIWDEQSGFEAKPVLQPGIMAAAYCPAGLTRRNLQLSALSPGGLFMGVQAAWPQPRWSRRFRHSQLPQVR